MKPSIAVLLGGGKKPADAEDSSGELPPDEEDGDDHKLNAMEELIGAIHKKDAHTALEAFETLCSLCEHEEGEEEGDEGEE